MVSSIKIIRIFLSRTLVSIRRLEVCGVTPLYLDEHACPSIFTQISLQSSLIREKEQRVHYNMLCADSWYSSSLAVVVTRRTLLLFYNQLLITG